MQLQPDDALALANAFDRWVADSAQVGCVFARYLTRTARMEGRRIIGAQGDTAAQIIAAETASAETDPDVIRLSIVLPEVSSAADMARLCQALAQAPHWRLDGIDRPTRDPDHRLFGLRCEMAAKSSGRPVDIEWLAFGPFDEYPPTRQSPVAVLEGFVDPSTLFSDDNDGRWRAHLALLPTPKLAQIQFERMEQATRAARWASIGEAEDHRAKARVTFTVTEKDADEIGI